MSSYETLAGCYDELTEDVAYTKRADFIEKLMGRSKVPVRTVLDLACGTGTMTAIFTRRGYELIAVDGSEDMLAVAREKAAGLPGEPPVFIHQDMPKLDLYGTVEAAICCLDSLNYLTSPRDLRRTLGRLRLFIQPGGVLIFDINTPYKLQGLDGQVFLDEREDVYCVWRTEFEKRSRICTYYMDIFCADEESGLWERGLEVHRERAYTPEELTEFLREAGFQDIRQYGCLKMRRPGEQEQRIFFAARKDPHMTTQI